MRDDWIQNETGSEERIVIEIEGDVLWCFGWFLNMFEKEPMFLRPVESWSDELAFMSLQNHRSWTWQIHTTPASLLEWQFLPRFCLRMTVPEHQIWSSSWGLIGFDMNESIRLLGDLLLFKKSGSRCLAHACTQSLTLSFLLHCFLMCSLILSGCSNSSSSSTSVTIFQELHGFFFGLIEWLIDFLGLFEPFLKISPILFGFAIWFSLISFVCRGCSTNFYSMFFRFLNILLS